MAVHCSNWRSAKIAVAVAVLAGLVGTPACAAVLLQHSGNTDPTTEGFGNHASSYGPVPGAWQMSGPSCCDYYEYLLSSAQTAALGSANEWTLTARFNNFATPDAGIPWGTYVRLLLNNTAFDLALFSNGTGDQILSLDTPGINAPDHTIDGLGTQLVTLSIIYDNSNSSANVYVDGGLVISGYQGHAVAYPLNFLSFGGAGGDFANVELLTGTLSTPEPSTWAILLAGLAGLGVLGYRTANDRRAAT